MRWNERKRRKRKRERAIQRKQIYRSFPPPQG